MQKEYIKWCNWFKTFLTRKKWFFNVIMYSLDQFDEKINHQKLQRNTREVIFLIKSFD
jgi:hypothetical protein